ncbi:hypothetical protein H845_3673 (plasmid) [Komagataeibacter xylinus E25]|nr:hypothetical protein H845_3673 [Komagataeibacter xylinus E25]
MIDRFPAAILSACLILTSATARADPPWGHGGHDRRGSGGAVTGGATMACGHRHQAITGCSPERSTCLWRR